ncbi:MAG: hypothetical protein ACRCWJ_07445, partial [Casimicrobium sp.]
GAASSDYTVASSTCAATLAASAQCSVTIAFAPSALGTRTASVDFAGGAITSVALSGVGFAANVQPTVAVPTTPPWVLGLLASLLGIASMFSGALRRSV